MKDGEVKSVWNEPKKEGIRPGADDPINTRVYRAVMPVVVAYLLDTHLNLARSRPGEPREKPHTSSTSHLGCLSLRKRVEPTMRANCPPVTSRTRSVTRAESRMIRCRTDDLSSARRLSLDRAENFTFQAENNLCRIIPFLFF